MERELFCKIATFENVNGRSILMNGFAMDAGALSDERLDKTPVEPELLTEAIVEDAQEDADALQAKREAEVRDQLQIKQNVPFPLFERKLVVCLRTDTKLKTAQLSSLLGDAVLKQCMKMKQIDPVGLGQWYRYGQAKIALKVPNGEVMTSLVESATANNIPFTIMENNGVSIALALGPGPKEEIDKVSGNLKLL